jgi:hypothetical protein
MGGDVDFKGYEQDQGQPFPAHLSDALDASDPVFFIDDLVEGLELKSFESRYSVTGERALSCCSLRVTKPRPTRSATPPTH